MQTKTSTSAASKGRDLVVMLIEVEQAGEDGGEAILLSCSIYSFPEWLSISSPLIYPMFRNLRVEVPMTNTVTTLQSYLAASVVQVG